MNSPGKFIVFEGLDGSGQSTQVGLLAEYLTKIEREVLVTKEPTQDSAAGREILEVLTHQKTLEPLALQKLFAEDRKHHLDTLILPALARGTVVISDRYRWSTYAFGSINCDLEELMALNKSFPEPDITFYMRVSPEVSIQRITKRGKPVEFFEKKEKLEKVSIMYDKLIAMFPASEMIDGERPIPVVHQDIVARLEKIL
jgi:dTMP kinase